jgi:small-conductance mechanosensitive channel
VLLREFGDSAINFEVQVYCPPRDFLSVRHQTVLAIDKALKAADITIAFPQRDIHFPETLRIARAETRPSRNGSGGDRNAGDSGNDPVRRHGATTHQTASDDANGDDDADGAS